MPRKTKFNLLFNNNFILYKRNNLKTWNGWVKKAEDKNANINEVNHLPHIWSTKSIPLIKTRVAEISINEWDIK